MKKALPLEAMLMQQLEAKKAGSSAKQCEVPVSLMKNMFIVGYANSASWISRHVDAVTGKWTAKTVGKVTDTTLTEALARVAILRHGLAAGRSPNDAMLTVGHLVERMYPDSEENKQRAKDAFSRFNCHIRGALGHMLVQAVQEYHLASCIEKMPKHLSVATRNRVLALLKTIFGYAMDVGLIDKNPAARLKLKRENNARQRVLDASEIRAVTAPDETDACPLPRLLNRFLLSTALRLSEALTAKFSQLDLDTRFLHLPTSKNGKPRAVPLSAEALDVIKTLVEIRRNEFLFPGRLGGHLTRPSSALKRMQEKNGVEGFCFHDMRRTACSIALNAGIPLLDASRLLGHSSTAVTQTHYAVLHSDRLHAAADTISKALRAAVGNAE
ncbi:tyrosine-type recombinase/integrase [Massilia sp. TWP1-3-3]|uniref:tyrosine-type recombinase/integrase n=1 Tax=Massilia sp. TWP1-3-3 TaxID=2804573 RepID=UPI003CEEB7CA